MKIHELKILPQFFKELISGSKNFEIRRHDRDFQIGDILKLKEWNHISYTGKEHRVIITSILTSQEFQGLADNYVALGVLSIESIPYINNVTLNEKIEIFCKEALSRSPSSELNSTE